jgi:secreted trypsin-like serine protease
MKKIKTFALFVLTCSSFAQASDHLTSFNLSPFIINGKGVEPEKLPWQVLIESDLYRNGIFIGTGSCGGSIIASRWVVTAAHCLSAAGDGVRGPSDVTVKLSRGQVASFAVEKAIINPGWNGDFTKGNDIALLKIVDSFPMNTAIKLPTANEYADAQLDFTSTWSELGVRAANLIASGYGLMANGQIPALTNLQYVWLSGVPTAFNQCTDFNGDGTSDIGNDQLICAVSPDPNKIRDTCSGDSGGPLIWQNPLNEKDSDYGIRLLGLTSFGAANCDVLNAQSGYTNLATHTVWINTVFAEEGSGSIAQIPTSKLSFDPMSLSDTTPDAPLPPVIENTSDSGGSVSFGSLLMLLGLCAFRMRKYKKAHQK